MIAAVCGGVRVVSVYAPNGRRSDSTVLRGEARVVRPARALAQRGASTRRAARARRRLQRRARRRRRLGPARLPRRHARLAAASGRRSRGFRALGARRRVPHCTTRSPSATRWWDYRAGNFHKNFGMRIDHLLVTAPVADARGLGRDRSRGAQGQADPSDHAPLVIDLDSPGHPFDAGWSSADSRIAARLRDQR